VRNKGSKGRQPCWSSTSTSTSSREGVPAPADEGDDLHRRRAGGHHGPGGDRPDGGLPLSSPETYHFVQSVEEVFEACDQFPDRFIKFGTPTRGWRSTPPSRTTSSRSGSTTAPSAPGGGEVTANLAWDDPRYQNLLRATDELGLPLLSTSPRMSSTPTGSSPSPASAAGAGPEAVPQDPVHRPLPGVVERGGRESVARRPGRVPQGEGGPRRAVPELLRTYPNIWGDLSAGSGYNALARDPEWAYGFLEEFQDRLMMGLDICIPSNDRCELLGSSARPPGEADQPARLCQDHGGERLSSPRAVKETSLVDTRYAPVEDGFRIVGSPETFNRALYGGTPKDPSPSGTSPPPGTRRSSWARSAIGGSGRTAATPSAALHGRDAVTRGITSPLLLPRRAGRGPHRRVVPPVAGHGEHLRTGWMEYAVKPFFQCYPRSAPAWSSPLQSEDGFLVGLEVGTDQRENLVIGFGGVTDFLGNLVSPSPRRGSSGRRTAAGRGWS